MMRGPSGSPRAGALGAALVVAGLGVGACDGGGDGHAAGEPARTAGPAVARPDSIPSPAPPGSAEPNLVVGPDGVYLSWLEATGPGRHALRLARWDGSGWSEPATVVEREGLFVNWADFPSLALLDDGTLAAHWLQKSGPGTYAYDVRLALSRDGGATWSEDRIPHRDGVEAEHGFVSLLPVDGVLGIAWLDGRETVDGGTMTLRYSTLSADGELGPETVLDTTTCDCCQTGLAATSAGPVAVYRGRTADEVRDILIARRVDGEWTPGVPVHDDGWVIAACPVNGPAVAARGSRVAVAWFTAASADTAADPSTATRTRRGRVLAAFSSDAGATFGPPIRVDDGGAVGRVDLELLDDGSALVAWLERVDGAGEVRVRAVDEHGAGPARVVTGTSTERASGFPRMVRWGDHVVFAWTSAGADTRVRTAVAALDGPAGGDARTDGTEARTEGSE